MAQDEDLGRSLRGRMPDGAPNPVDVHVGSRVRLRRMLMGLSQERLGEALGLTFQQVQKYERGINRIGASRLWDLSRVLGTPVGYFFDNMDEAVARASPRQLVDCPPGDDPAGLPASADLTAGSADAGHREVLELIRAYNRIADPMVRRRIYELTRTLSLLPGLGLADADSAGLPSLPEPVLEHT
ncbi:hypothetical protein GCM10027256_14300 [Novispirillum itersonii subsp. nipponicum]|uniref:Transcriptional regulator with XRE-family HTH domain n=2 Tax=Novispirillum itersonii TaxID=189 RepID=A0A7W9ZD07_NOVIT|nr:helix-turn-helix transcriptional regulator [Novispirillum itersonii]MBB6209227.1 transcriptional regulator with XRE-family HTH domain [Novispirillum itersonii]